VSPEILARLRSLNIQVSSEGAEYCVFARDHCVAIAQVREGCVTVGSSGLMTEYGLSYLLWREGQPVLASHGGQETPAAPEQVEAVRQFSADLKQAFHDDRRTTDVPA
jgi:hypothetical protein